MTIAKRPSSRPRDARKSARDLPDGTSALACDMLARRAICAWLVCWGDGCTIAVSSADRPLLHRRRNPARWNMFGEQGAFLRKRDGKRIRHCEERKRRSKSIVSLRGGMDCFAALAMTRSESVPTSGKRLVRSLPSLRHSAVIARSAATKQSIFLCCAHALLHQTCHRARICTPRWL